MDEIQALIQKIEVELEQAASLTDGKEWESISYAQDLLSELKQKISK